MSLCWCNYVNPVTNTTKHLIKILHNNGQARGRNQPVKRKLYYVQNSREKENRSQMCINDNRVQSNRIANSIHLRLFRLPRVQWHLLLYQYYSKYIFISNNTFYFLSKYLDLYQCKYLHFDVWIWCLTILETFNKGFKEKIFKSSGFGFGT